MPVALLARLSSLSADAKITLVISLTDFM